MKEIIGDFEANDETIAKWTKAADTWRLPYWDWTTEHIPEAVKLGQLELVEMPVYRTQEVTGGLVNPLHKFTNPSLKPMGDPSMGKFRIPPHKDDTHGTYPV